VERGRIRTEESEDGEDRNKETDLKMRGRTIIREGVEGKRKERRERERIGGQEE